MADLSEEIDMSETNEPTRRCSTCGERKPVETGFYRKSRGGSGYRTTCRDCSRAYQAEVKREVTDFVDAYKMQSGCADCGWCKHPQALEFDHRPDEIKGAEISDMRKAPLSLVIEEIAKCDVVCANCHRIRTFNRRDFTRNQFCDIRRQASASLLEPPEPDLLSLLLDDIA